MKKSLLKFNKLIMLISTSLIKLPTPINLSIWWNFGSLLGLFLMIQIITGLFLSMHYIPNVNYAFNSIIHIMNDVNYGWFMRLIHMNGASFFFMCVYLHIGRGIYYNSYKFIYTWYVGIMILLIMMGTAFMGYVLPWGQMSFWGATVITNLLSALPYIGQMLVEWLWGGFSVENPTLNRFYSFHFILPFILLMMVMIHLMYLHETGSNNPLGLNSNFYKINFHNYFSLKDILGYMIIMYMFIYMIIEYPYLMGDPENFLMASCMITPMHIQPEWYFLFAYTILRTIPNKLGGVIALLMSILILFILPMLMSKFQSLTFYPINQLMFWIFICNFFMLTWLGSQPIEYPFTLLNQIYTIMYFSYFIIDYFMKLIWDHFLLK